MEGGDLRMSAIDNRIVKMQFDNAEFERRIATTLRSLDALNKGIKLTESAKGLNNLSAAAKKVDLKNVENSVDGISNKFKAMSVIGVTALATIAHQAVTTGLSLVKSLTLEPLQQGFAEYETNLNAIQTILANTSAAGTNLKQVNAALDELNHYSDQTIYNFSEMAKNIGTFTAAGVDLKRATASIKGIANLAALSGSNSAQASQAMYQLSQAISAGRVSLEDWNSVVNAGMGGTVFQRALAQNAEKMGTLKKGAVELKGAMKNVTIEGESFRESITAKPGEKSWLTSEVLTQTLAQFTGDLTDAQLKAQGFNTEQIKAIQTQAKMAKEAATQVKTFSQLVSTLGESAASGWTETWRTVFGDFEEARSLFTNVNNVLGGFVAANADARNKVLADWKQLGGRTALIESIGNAFKFVMKVVKPIGDAFKQIFPPTTGKQLYDLTIAIRDFTRGLTVSKETADKIKRTFAGFFAVLDIGFTIVKEVVKALFNLAGGAEEGAGSFLDATANIGDFLVKARDAIKAGDYIGKAFRFIGDVLEVPLRLLGNLGDLLGSLFGDVDYEAAAKGLEEIGVQLEPLGRLGDVLVKSWGAVLSILDEVFQFSVEIGNNIAMFFGGFGDLLSGAFEGIDFTDVLGTINTGLFAGLVLLFKNFFKGLIDKDIGGFGGFFDNISGAFETLTGSLNTMQNTLRAATLLQIAIAVGILTASMNTLSKIDADGLTRGGTAIGVLFAQLLGAMLIFEKTSGFVGFAKMPFVAASMILMATALNVLVQAVEPLSKMNWDELSKGLTGVMVLLAGVVAAARFMPSQSGLVGTGLGLLVLAAGIKVLASAVQDLSGLGWEELSKGLVGVGVLLGALALFTKFANVSKMGVLSGAGLLLLAAGIKVLASAMQDLGGMSWESIGKGLTSMAGALAIAVAALMLIPPTAPLAAAGVLGVAISLGLIADALNDLGQMSWEGIGKGLTAMLGALTLIAAALIVIPPTAPLGAAGLLIAAISLKQVADVLDQMGNMGWDNIAKAMTALAGSLLIIGVAVTAMSGALAGAAALLVVSAALAVLSPVLQTFGNMSWEEMAKGLLMLAGVFVVLGAAGLLLTPLVPTLIGLGAAIALMGVGMLAAGAGLLAFSAGLTALGVAGAAATAGIVAIVAGLIGLLPMVAQEIGEAIVAFAKVIAISGPAITDAIVAVMMSLINAINRLTPPLVDMLLRALLALLRLLVKYGPALDRAGADLIISLLKGAKQYVPQIVNVAVDLIIAFVNALSNNLQRIIKAGADLIIKFVNGLATQIRASSPQLGAAGANLASAIIEGMAGGLSAGVGVIASRAREVASSALSAAKDVLGIASPSKEFEKIGKFVIDGFRKGLDGNKQQVYTAYNELKQMLLDAHHTAGAQVDKLEAKLNELNKNRKKNKKAIAATKQELAQAKLEEARTKAAFDTLNKGLAGTNAKLGKLADQYDVVSAKLDAARKKLEDATKVRDDYSASIRDQYNNLPETSGQVTLAQYVDDLRKQIAKTSEFATKIAKLRALGLNDNLYKDLLAKGPETLPFIDDLLAAGKKGVETVNALGGSLEYQAKNLGEVTSKALYQAGVDAAAGLVKGLQNQQAALEKMMDKLADSMVKAIKAKLGIKSPSKEFAEIGVDSVKGLVKGIETTSKVAQQSAEQVGTDALDALRQSLSNANWTGGESLEIRPSIRPVLDLTDISNGSAKLAAMIAGEKMSVTASYSRSADILNAVRNAQTSKAAEAAAANAGGTTFIQNNTSPKALPAAEIYRQTKNQLSVAKGASKK